MPDLVIPQRRDVWVNRDGPPIRCTVVGRSDDQVIVVAVRESTFLGDGRRHFGLATFMRNFRLLYRPTSEED